MDNTLICGKSVSEWIEILSNLSWWEQSLLCIGFIAVVVLFVLFIKLYWDAGPFSDIKLSNGEKL